MKLDCAMSLWGGPAEPECLIDGLIRAAEANPGRPAVVADRSVTYAELLAWSGRIAALLAEHGVMAGDPLAVACPRGAPAVAALVAAVLCGATYVPLDLEYPRQRLEFMMRDSGARVALHAGAPPDLHMDAVPLRIPDPPAGAVARPVRAELSWVVRHDPDRPVYIIYTSGSTGWPKGVVLQHTVLDNVARWQAGHSPAPDLRTAQFAPLNFDVSFQEIFGTLCGGGTLVIVPEQLRRNPTGLIDWLIEHRVERLFLPYVALQMLAVAAGFSAPVHELSLVEINVAGEQLVCTNDIREFFTALPQCRLVNHYGQSESAMVSAHVLRGRPADWPVISPIGTPLPGCELLLDNLDPDSPNVGELLVAGRPVALGYLRRPELNAARYREIEPPTAYGNHRVFRTGDLVRFGDSVVHYLSRMDDDVKLRGIRINLSEVDSQLMAIPEISAAASVVVRESGGPPALRAGVVLRNGDLAFDEPTALRRLREVLPAVSVPVSLVVLEALPRAPSGKTDREAVGRLIRPQDLDATLGEKCPSR